MENMLNWREVSSAQLMKSRGLSKFGENNSDGGLAKRVKRSTPTEKRSIHKVV